MLRQGYRENGKVKHRTIANISHCSAREIEAIRIALKKKKELSALYNLANAKAENGKHIGTVSSLVQIANRLGIVKALGTTKPALLVLWMILARLIDQGSRLSAVRLAQHHAACEILGLDAFREDDLYEAMDWLSAHQDSIEQSLFGYSCQNASPATPIQIFLYDVTSSYLEGQKNELADWGYNGDRKKGEKQIVYGLLTREDGDPIAVKAFEGNMSDHKTVKSQIEKLKDCFGCEHITLVGDKGMIKSGQISELEQVGFHYITSITKAQIETLLHRGLFQMELFDEKVCEVEDTSAKVRYVLRRNPLRAEEMKGTRQEKVKSIEEKVQQANLYLNEHRKAKVQVRVRLLNEYINRLKMKRYVQIEGDEKSRQVRLKADKEELSQAGRLDGW